MIPLHSYLIYIGLYAVAVATPGPSLVEVDMTAIGAFPPYAPYNRMGIYAQKAAE